MEHPCYTAEKKKRKPERKVKHIVLGQKVKVRFSITSTRRLEVHKTSWNGRVVESDERFDQEIFRL